jgi:protein TonB
VLHPVNKKLPPIQAIDRSRIGREIAEPEKSPGPGPDPTTPDPPRDDTPAFISVDTPPVPTFAPKPTYPEWAREAGVEGKVLLRVLVGADGAPKNVVVVSGTNGLTDDAVKAAWRWRFSPALSNKKPVEVWVEIPMTFRL